MAKVHDKFVIELAEVIKGYGNDPDVDDPFRLSEFYRFYELPEIAVSANHFKTMIPLEVVEKNAQPGWIPCSTEMPPTGKDVLVTLEGGTVTDGERWEPQEGKWFLFGGGVNGLDEDVIAWMPLPAPWEGGQDEAGQ